MPSSQEQGAFWPPPHELGLLIHISGRKQYVFSCVWLLLPNILFVRFLCAVIVSIVYSCSLLYNIVLYKCTVYLSIQTTLVCCCFQFETVITLLVHGILRYRTVGHAIYIIDITKFFQNHCTMSTYTPTSKKKSRNCTLSILLLVQSKPPNPCRLQ